MVEREVKKVSTKIDRITVDVTKNGKDQADAMLKSGAVFMEGLENISNVYAAWALSFAERSTITMSEALACKTVNEFAYIHNKWAQQNFESIVAGATELSELGTIVATNVFEPINDQLSNNIEKA